MKSLSTSDTPAYAGDLEDVIACELCGATQFAHQLSVKPWTLKRCCRCQIVFTSPRLTEVALNRHYERGYYEGTAQYFASQAAAVTDDQRSLARKVKRLLKSHSPVSLDVGCGGGQLVEAFSNAGFAAAGTEPSEAACQAAASVGRNVKNVELASFGDESFDCVTAMHVLEHISHPQAFLAEITRITKKNGVVVIEVPNFGCKASRALGAKWLPLYPDTHLFHYTPVTLQQALRANRLVPIRVRHLGGLGLLSRPTPSTAAFKPALASHVSPQPAAREVRSWKSFAWSVRSPLLRVPGIRPFVRWLAWEVLGHGEYVRVIARKAAT
jgi:SAM-dependent methyltransferase